MLKKYSIVEFSDGVQIIPSSWMNAEKSNSVWPSHIRNDYTLNKIIMKGLPPVEGDEWDSCNIIKWFCSTDNYNRALELRGDAMDTSNVEESDGKNEGKYYNRTTLQERKRRKTRVALSSEEEDTHHEPPRKKQNKTVKTVLPVPPLRALLEQDFTNTPTTDHYYTTHTLHASPEEIEIPAPTAASPGPAPTAASPGPAPSAASPGPAPSAASPGPAPTAASPRPAPTAASPGPAPTAASPGPVRRAVSLSSSSSRAESSSSSSSSKFERFMMKSVAAINLTLNDMKKQLNRMEEKVAMISGNRNIIVDSETDFSTTHNLPINDEEGLRNFNNQLQDQAVFNAMVDVLKKTGGSNVAITTAMVLQKIMNDCVAEQYSWCGRKQKRAFKSYNYLVKLILASVHATCSDRGLRATDMEIINVSGKWFAQTRKRIVRAEMKTNAV